MVCTHGLGGALRLAVGIAVMAACNLDTFGLAGGSAASTDASATEAVAASVGETTTAAATLSSTTTPSTMSSTDSPTTGTETHGPGDDEPHPELYPTDRTHSPISTYVADRLRGIATAPGGVDKQAAVFAKIGGQTTASANYMQCFASDAAIEDLPAELIPTLTFFRSFDLGMGVTSFDRVSAAAGAGFTSTSLASGAPTPIEVEVAATLPRFAYILVGTHDLEEDQPAELYTFADNLLDAVDRLLVVGVVPILSTIPQRSDLPLKDPYVPRYNAVVRAIAQGRQIPLVDLHRELAMLPNLGLTDTGDLSVFDSAMVDRPCHFSEGATLYGYNVHNLASLRALDRARQVVVEGVPDLDPPGPRLQGAGTPDSPYEIPSLPFVDLRSTMDSPSDAIDAYGGACDAAKDESGPERLYRLTVDVATELRVMAFDRGSVNVDVHVLSGVTPGDCLARNDREVSGPLPPGTYYIAVDSFAGDVPGGAAGEYSFVVLAE